MEFRLSEQQEMIRQMAADFAANEIVPYCADWDHRREVPLGTLAKMQELGFMTIGVPLEYGGDGLDNTSQCLVCEEIAKGDAGMATTIVASTILASAPILVGANHEQKKWWYGRHLDGAVCGFCLTEPSAGSDALSISTRCIKDGDHYIINGTKQFITNGGIAMQFSVMATLDQQLGNKGICAFMVDRNWPGVSIGKEEDKLGIRSSSTTQVIFEDVRVPASMMLGKEGDGLGILMETLDLSRTAVAAMATGIATAALEAAISYANQRQQFGQPIAALQAIQFMLADMAVRAETSRLLYLKAAYLQDVGGKYKTLSSMAKLHAGDSAMQNAIDAVQVFGGYGYTKNYPVEKYMRDAKIMQIVEGTAQVQRIVIGKYLSQDGYTAFDQNSKI
ncbi:MAG: acyl-CoA dehydrogenase family protein [Syntrophomonadaceae bacterium]|jgi:alkylation response protein AidB-like acyl-CoA dehydrogenase|nr:acyl-CoA dehydrogenase family protein [Bacillota bacterium]NLL86851.1 acyl-CoA dehydrogenase [Syntrophomonadaceae bacterium]